MNGVDNIAGYTLSTGTGGVVISDTVAQYDPINSNVPDGATRDYKIQFVDPTVSGEYETGTGIWTEGTLTLSRDTIDTSSNGGLLVNFSEGQKVVFITNNNASLTSMGTKVETATAKILTVSERAAIAASAASIAALGNSSTRDVGTTAGTVAAGDDSRLRVLGTTAGTSAEGNDSRFGSVDFGSLPAASGWTGAELLAAEQSGGGVKVAGEIITGTPTTQMRTHAFNRLRGYTRFSKTLPAFVSTNGAICELEPWVAYQGGTGAQVQQLVALGVAGFSVATGTTTTGYSAIESLQRDNLFATTRSMQQRATLNVLNLPSTEAYTAQLGFIVGAPALATLGMYFQLSAANANWEAIVKNGAGTTTIDTGVLAATGLSPIPVYRIFYDSTSLSTKFYIDGTLVATVPNATRTPDATIYPMVLSIRKSAGTTLAAIVVAGHAYDVETDPIVNYA
jgi:hypothetical protein